MIFKDFIFLFFYFWLGYTLRFFYYYMNRKRKTEKYQNLRFPIVPSRPSVKYSALLHPVDAALQTMVRTIIEQFVARAQRMIYLRDNATGKINEWLEKVEQEDVKYEALEVEQSSKSPRTICEEEPTVASKHVKVAQPKEEYKTNINQSQYPSSQKQEVQEEQITDKNEECRVKQFHIKKWEQSKRCQRNQFVNIHPNLQIDRNDRSQQIQHLLRRKKQLLYQPKCAGRVHTENSRTLSTDIRDRDKKHYYQDDDGEPIEIVTKPIKYHQDSVPLLKLANIRVAPSQQIATTNNIYKKPMLEMIAARRVKRKGVGDTCVLIQQMFDRDSRRAGVQEVIQEAWKLQKGVRLTVKQRRMTTVVRLPTLR